MWKPCQSCYCWKVLQGWHGCRESATAALQVGVLIVGAGPTGLGAATRLHQHGYDDWLLLDAVRLDWPLSCCVRTGSWHAPAQPLTKFFLLIERLAQTSLLSVRIKCLPRVKEAHTMCLCGFCETAVFGFVVLRARSLLKRGSTLPRS